MLLAGLIGTRKQRRKEKMSADLRIQVWITAGILLSAMLRLLVVGFAEVSAFGIGTYPMYLAVVYPLFLLYAFCAFNLAGRLRTGDTPQEL